MEDKNTSTPPPQNPEHNPFGELDLPAAHELTVSEVQRRLFQETGESDALRARQKFLEKIAKETGKLPESLHLRGPAQVLKGEKPILAVCHNQNQAFFELFDVLAYGAYPYHASVRAAGGARQAEATVRFASLNPQTQDHLIISQGLAKELKVHDGQDITITQVYIRPEDVDLDKL